jgi:hypothetical protein
MTEAMAPLSPSWESEITSWVPLSPRAFDERRNVVQKAPSSESPTSNPRTSRRPSAASASDRPRDDATSASRSPQIRETSDLLIPVSAPRAFTRSSTFRVETPCRWASIATANSA